MMRGATNLMAMKATIASKMTIMMTTNEDDDLVESEYEISDGVSGIWVIPIIKVRENVREQLAKRTSRTIEVVCNGNWSGYRKRSWIPSRTRSHPIST